MKLKSKLLMPALLLGALVATSCGDGTQQLGDSLADGQDVTYLSILIFILTKKFN